MADEEDLTMITPTPRPTPGEPHALFRTSPKGGPFIGRCMRCGMEGLTFATMNSGCANPAGETQEQSLIRAIEGDDQ